MIEKCHLCGEERVVTKMHPANSPHDYYPVCDGCYVLYYSDYDMIIGACESKNSEPLKQFNLIITVGSNVDLTNAEAGRIKQQMINRLRGYSDDIGEYSHLKIDLLISTDPLSETLKKACEEENSK